MFTPLVLCLHEELESGQDLVNGERAPQRVMGRDCRASICSQHFLLFLLKKGQTQCQRLPHEWGLGKGITEVKSYPCRNSAERRVRTQDLVTRPYGRGKKVLQFCDGLMASLDSVGAIKCRDHRP
jgi:hypothetical protein